MNSNSKANRDRRDQSFARSVIAEATRRHNDSLDTHPRCTHDEVRTASNGVKAFRRCTRDDGHVGEHVFGSWCLR